MLEHDGRRLGHGLVMREAGQSALHDLAPEGRGEAYAALVRYLEAGHKCIKDYTCQHVVLAPNVTLQKVNCQSKRALFLVSRKERGIYFGGWGS